MKKRMHTIVFTGVQDINKTGKKQCRRYKKRNS